MDGRCKDCKSWETPDPKESGHYFEDWLATGKRPCERIVGTECETVADRAEPAALRLSEWGELWTTPGFGCVLFAAKEAGE